MYFRLLDLTRLGVVPGLNKTIKTTACVFDTNMNMLFTHHAHLVIVQCQS